MITEQMPGMSPQNFSDDELKICADLQERIIRQSNKAVPMTLRKIYGVDDWNLVLDPVSMGLLVPQLIKAGLLPLSDCGRDGRNHRVYRIDFQ